MPIENAIGEKTLSVPLVAALLPSIAMPDSTYISSTTMITPTVGSLASADARKPIESTLSDLRPVSDERASERATPSGAHQTKNQTMSKSGLTYSAAPTA